MRIDYTHLQSSSYRHSIAVAVTSPLDRKQIQWSSLAFFMKDLPGILMSLEDFPLYAIERSLTNSREHEGKESKDANVRPYSRQAGFGRCKERPNGEYDPRQDIQELRPQQMAVKTALAGLPGYVVHRLFITGTKRNDKSLGIGGPVTDPILPHTQKVD